MAEPTKWPLRAREEQARLFVATWPPAELVEQLRELPHATDDRIRWSTEDQWHVTLRFLGSVPLDEVPALVTALEGAATTPHSGLDRGEATAGPAVVRINAKALGVPVAGLDGQAAAVAGAVAGIGEETGMRPFRGHLTVARARGKHRFDLPPEEMPVSARWEVAAVALVRSHLEPAGARYERLVTVPLS